jgi:hypothetical protein
MFCFLLLLVKELHSRAWFSWSIIKIIAFIVSIRIITTAKVLVFFFRGEIFHSVYVVTTDIVLSHTSMELSESMELPLIIKTNFDSGFQRDLFPWACDCLTSYSIIVTVIFSQVNIYFLVSFILPVPTILGEQEEMHRRCQSFFMISYKRLYSQRSSSNAS